MPLKMLIVAALVWLSMVLGVRANEVEDPVADFVMTKEFREIMEESKLESIARIELALGKNEKKAVLLASSGDRHGNLCWTIYLPVKGGFKVASRPTNTAAICFGEGNAYFGYISEIKHQGIIIHHGNPAESVEFVVCWAVNDKILQKTIARVKGDDLEKSTLPGKYFDGRSPRSFKIEPLYINDLRAKGYRIPVMRAREGIGGTESLSIKRYSMSDWKPLRLLEPVLNFRSTWE